MERIFSFFWKNQKKKNMMSPGLVLLEEYKNQFEVFAKLVYPENKIQSIGGSLWGVGFIGNDLLLPSQICWSQNQDLNLRLTKLLILKSIAIKHLNIGMNFHDRDRIFPRLFVLQKMPMINLWIDRQIPYFADFERDAYFDLMKELSWLKGDDLFMFWKKNIQSRDHFFDDSKFYDPLFVKQWSRKNQEPFAYLHATVPLPFRAIVEDSNSDDHSYKNIQNRKFIESEKKRKQKEFSMSVDLEKEGQTNPVMHSFEKMETVDDYDGGKRIASGDDELDEHQNAIDEIELNRHTTSGETSSVYSQDIAFSRNSMAKEDPPDMTRKHFTYPEWSQKENTYWKSYCHVFQRRPAVLNNIDEVEKYKIKNKIMIEYWRRKLQSLIHEPLWKNRLTDGTELDLDQVVRLISEINSQSGAPQIYARKLKSVVNISVLILADVSYSTGAWIQGEQVISLIKEYLVLASCLFDEVFDQTSIAITSSETRKNIDYCELKSFKESWQSLNSGLSEVFPREYTRLGPAIRHASYILEKEKSSLPILILLTDAKPTDLDPYEGQHGESDVKKAVFEAQGLGIHVLPLIVSNSDPKSIQNVFENASIALKSQDFCKEVFQFFFRVCLKKS